jgi:hypothetical protein
MEENKSHETETAPYCAAESFRGATFRHRRGRGILLREECSKQVWGCRLEVISCLLLVIGYWLLVIGCGF